MSIIIARNGPFSGGFSLEKYSNAQCFFTFFPINVSGIFILIWEKMWLQSENGRLFLSGFINLPTITVGLLKPLCRDTWLGLSFRGPGSLLLRHVLVARFEIVYPNPEFILAPALDRCSGAGAWSLFRRRRMKLVHAPKALLPNALVHFQGLGIALVYRHMYNIFFSL